MPQELIPHQKTIYHQFPTFEEFHHEAINCVQRIISSAEDENLFGFYSYCVYDRWKLNQYLGYPEMFYSKLYSGMASKFFTFKKRERLWSNIFEHLKLEMSKLIDIKTTEYTKDDRTKYLDANKSLIGDWDRTTTNNTFEKGENREAQRIINKEKPYSTIDLIHGDYGHLQDRADWLSTEAYTDTGYIGIEKDEEGNPILDSEGKPNKIINPNWNKRITKGKNKDYSHKTDKTKEDSKETDHGTIDKTITTQEQPVFYQQLARIIPSFSLVETKMDDLTDFSHLFDNVFLPQGEFRWNANTFQLDYITRQQLIEEREPEKKKKAKAQKDPHQDLSFDEWNELYQEQEQPIMPTWYLERLYRYKKRIQKKPNPDETDQARLELCEILLDTFYREPYWPPLAEFEKIMGTPPDWEGRVIGFKEFKSTWHEALQTAEHFRKQGVRLPQLFYILLGKPGVGKSEISQRLAQALKRPIQIINVGGMDDGGELEGKRATLQSANYGKMMEAFVERSFLTEVGVEDLEREIEEIRTRKEIINEGTDDQTVITVPRKPQTLTEWEEERMETLEEEIKEWKEDNQRRQSQDKPIRKTKKKAYRSRSPVILLDEFEKASREDIENVIGKIMDRELNYTFLDKYFNFNLDISQAIILLTANLLEKVAQFVQDRGEPVNIELLTWEQRKKILGIISTIYCRAYGIAKLRNKISERFLELCIPETWGIRGGINNLQKVMLFLVGLEVKGKTNEITDLAEFDEFWETSREDYVKKESGVIKLTYLVGGERKVLTLTKRIGIEEREIKEVGRVKEIITGKDVETGKAFVEDWANGSPDEPAEEYWWGSPVVREVN